MSWQSGKVAEWFKVLAWKASVRAIVPGVRIPPFPQKETSESERWEEARAFGAGVSKRVRREASTPFRLLVPNFGGVY